MGRYGQSRKGSRSKKKAQGLKAAVFVVVLIALAGTAVGVMALLNPDVDGFNPTPTVGAGSPMIDNDTFAEGIFVDDIALGGLTMEQAKQQVEVKQKEYIAANSVTITKDGQTALQIGMAETAYTFDTDAILSEAFQQGRQGTEEERQAAVELLKTTPVKLVTTATIDPAALEQKVRDLAEPYTKAAVDAAFVKYDIEKPKGERLVFSPDTPGEKVDADSLWAAVKTAFETRAFGTVEMQVVPVPAAITLESVQNEMKLIGVYETEIKNSKAARLNNINLANKAISGKILMPGEIFTMNGLTGARTEAKGYKDAPVDRSGMEDIGIAGGVCQVSGTLYNAAINAGPNRIEIVERRNHSVPSSYMGLGKDATVDFDSKKDIRFKNITDKPMLIVVYYDKVTSRKYDYHEHAEIYGVPGDDPYSYKLVTKTVKKIPKKVSDKPIYFASKAVGAGKIEHVGGRDGVVVDVFLYKVDKDGKEILVKKLYTDTYPATSDVIAYYYKDPKPTPTASPSPTPEATPAPTRTATPAPHSPTPVPATPSPSPSPEPTAVG